MSLNPRLTEWHGKRVWLVGASSGIGLALARELHGLGAQVIVSARSLPALEAFSQDHPGSVAVPIDVTDGEALQQAAEQVLAQGPLDVVCYCAGHYRPMRATAIDLPDWLRHHNVNTVGLMHLLNVVVPAMLKRGQGHISLISSVAGYRGLPQSLAYGPTKAALINLAESLAPEMGVKGVSVSVINPGFVETPLTAQNDFPMPFLMKADEAARRSIAGLAEGRFEVAYPRRFVAILKALRLLPYPLFFRLIRRAVLKGG